MPSSLPQVSEAVLDNRKLSAFEQCLAQGALGTASWREKRDKFRGDSEVRAHYTPHRYQGAPPFLGHTGVPASSAGSGIGLASARRGSSLRADDVCLRALEPCCRAPLRASAHVVRCAPRGSRAALRAQIGTLERAYQIVQMLNTPSQQFNVLGLIAPGAGWAGGLTPATPAPILDLPDLR